MTQQVLDEPGVTDALRQLGLLAPNEEASMHPLTGGVSSNIWLIMLPAGPVCLKQALGKLKVEADWYAPVERNHYEVEWLRVAQDIVPKSIPHLVAQDASRGLFVMSYMDPADHPVWKEQLLVGLVRATTASAVAGLLVEIHAYAARHPELAKRFESSELFDALRLEPYLETTAAKNPDMADRLREIAERTRRTPTTLIHGDVSPKNILVGPNGPVLLDAECATWGDPAFDLAFCLNHLLLKAAHQPHLSEPYLKAFKSMTTTYARGIDWEPMRDLETRAIDLLIGLALARVDGKSPVEYLSKSSQARVRSLARQLLPAPPTTLDDLASAWHEGLRR
jgi:aminoglycoside phosphotransferase (APT) family kinase protein